MITLGGIIIGAVFGYVMSEAYPNKDKEAWTVFGMWTLGIIILFIGIFLKK